MITGIFLTIGSSFFLMLLLVSYFSKKRLTSIRNKLYRYLLVVTIVLLLTEIITTIYYDIGSSEILKLILLRIHWFTGFPWFLLLYFYSLCFLSNLNYNDILELIKKNKRCKLFLIFSIVYFVIYLFLPL